MILGAMKCGTTTLADLLKEHPQVSFCRLKEPEFFSKDPDWRANIDRYHALFEQRQGALYVEASTGLTFHPHFNRGIWNDLHAYNPALKFIYIVRDPIDRIVSHWMHVYQRGYIDKDLHEAIRTMPLLVNVSRYHAQVLPFIERFGRDRVLLLDFDGLMKDRRNTLDRVAAFVGIDPAGFGTAEKHSNPSIGGDKTLHWADDPPRWARWVRTLTPGPFRERVWRRITRDRSRAFTGKPEMSAEWMEAVIRLLESDLLRLEALLQRDLSHWWHRAGMEHPSKRLAP